MISISSLYLSSSPSRTLGTGSVVSRVVGGRPDGKLNNSDCENNLGKSSKRNGEKTVHTVGDIRDTDSELLGKVSGEFDISIVEKHTYNSGHGNTSMLTLDGTTTLEVGVVSGKSRSRILGGIKPSKRIVKSKRLSDSNGGVKRRKSLAKCSGGLQ